VLHAADAPSASPRHSARRLVVVPACRRSAFRDHRVGSVSDWLLIIGRRHLEHTLRVYAEHYDRERPHRALELHPPQATDHADPVAAETIERRDLLGGLIHEYHAAAA
jgi:hypothetical protein